MNNTTRSHLSSIPATVSFFPEEDEQRASLEHFIHDVYTKQYGADIRQFMPLLMGLHSGTDGYLAALGLRIASSGYLFLEHYLDRPVEKILSTVSHHQEQYIARNSIVEVGNLAAQHAGGTRWLIIALTAYLQGAGYDWVVFTSVTSLRNSFLKLGLQLFTLGPAEQSKLSEAEQANWGRYYESRPMIMAVNVHHTYEVLEKYLRTEQVFSVLQNIWQQSFAYGKTYQSQAKKPGLLQHTG